MIESIYPSHFWTLTYAHNTLGSFVDAVLLFLFLLFILYFVIRITSASIIRIIQSSQTTFDDMLLSITTKHFITFAFFLALYLALQRLTITPIVDHTFFIFMLISVTWYSTKVLQVIIDYFAQKKFDLYEGNPQLKAAMDLFSFFLKSFFWGGATLFALHHFGVDIRSILAGIGIGSIAIAFAVKGILEDLFSSFSIYLDKPFVIGDLIEVDGDKGIVQRIGIKTTRLKSLATGEEIIYANTDLTKKKIRNFRRMTTRRVPFKIGVLYETSAANLHKIPEILETSISAQEHARFDRAHMRSFADSAIVFSILYHIDTRNYDTYLNTHEKILHMIKEAFAQEGIVFAYPTQTIHLKK